MQMKLIDKLILPVALALIVSVAGIVARVAVAANASAFYSSPIPAGGGMAVFPVCLSETEPLNQLFQHLRLIRKALACRCGLLGGPCAGPAKAV